jgi:hypothetical protein
MPDLNDVVSSVKEHLLNKGYTVTHVADKHGIGAEIQATKGKDTFIIEAIGESSNSDINLVYTFGKLLKRIKKQNFWLHYSVAMPRSYYKTLKEFEEGSFEALKIHIFLVESFINLTHLDPKETIKLIRGLKTGEIINLDLLTDY